MPISDPNSSTIVAGVRVMREAEKMSKRRISEERKRHGASYGRQRAFRVSPIEVVT